MNKKTFFLALLFVLTITSNAQADCVVTVGGPGMNLHAVEDLTALLQKMFISKKLKATQVFTVTTLEQSMNLDADYMVYLTGDRFHVRAQFRDILLNQVMLEKLYSSALGLDAATKKITADISKEIVPTLPDYCR